MRAREGLYQEYRSLECNFKMLIVRALRINSSDASCSCYNIYSNNASSHLQRNDVYADELEVEGLFALNFLFFFFPISHQLQSFHRPPSATLQAIHAYPTGGASKRLSNWRGMVPKVEERRRSFLRHHSDGSVQFDKTWQDCHFNYSLKLS